MDSCADLAAESGAMTEPASDPTASTLSMFSTSSSDPTASSEPTSSTSSSASSASELASIEDLSPLGPPPPPHRPMVWWVVVGAVVLVAAVVAGVVLALQPSAPSSADELASLLVAPSGARSVQVKPDGNAMGSGAKWSVGRGWVAGQGRIGSITLAQFDTADQAQAVLARVTDHTPEPRRPVQGHPGAFYAAGDGVTAAGVTIRPAVGAGRKGTIVVYLFANGETPDAVAKLLADQLDRLP
jgi:hypothetical protein